MTTPLKPTDYKHIIAWGQKMRSFRSYIVAQQERACAAGAPVNAIYEKHDPSGPTGAWVTVDECHPDVRDEVNAAVASFSKG